MGGADPDAETDRGAVLSAYSAVRRRCRSGHRCRPRRTGEGRFHSRHRAGSGFGRPCGVGARIEIWQCDALGHYHHPRDGGGADPNFQGYGATVADREGSYRFRTIRPVAYPGRTPHIHFALSGRGFDRFTTQMYVAGEPLNDRDIVLSRIRDAAARQSVIVTLEEADTIETGALLGRFDIIVGA